MNREVQRCRGIRRHVYTPTLPGRPAGGQVRHARALRYLPPVPIRVNTTMVLGAERPARTRDQQADSSTSISRVFVAPSGSWLLGARGI